MGMLKHTFKKNTGKEGESNKLNSSTFDFLGIGNDWKESFFIVVCSKAFSVYGEVPDEEMISEVDLPHWMELNTLYEFRYENDKDESEAVEKLHGNKIHVIEPVFDKSMKGNHQFVVETKEKTTYYGADYCKQVNKWVVALRKAKMTSEEISRTKANALTKNIDPWIMLYRKGVAFELTKQMQQVQEHCTKELDSFINRISMKESDAKTFIKIISDAQTSFTQVIPLAN